MTRKQQQDVERDVVRRLLAARRLDISSPSTTLIARPPPEPDVYCKLADGTEQHFEVVEVVDSHSRHKLNFSAEVHRALFDAYLRLSTSDRATHSRRSYLISVRAGTTTRVMLKRAAAVLHELGAVGIGIHDAFAGGTNLAAIIEELHVRRTSLKHPLFHVSSSHHFGAWFEPTIDDKLRKKYRTALPVELVAYCDMHDSFTFEFGSRESLDARLRNETACVPFRRIWILDLASDRILALYPSAEVAATAAREGWQPWIRAP